MSRAASLRPLNSLPADTRFLTDVLLGLAKVQKEVPCKYFYDERGSQLFDAICELEEYYPTRTEIGIMREHVEEMVELMGTSAALIEYGSGSSVKSRLLLEHVAEGSVYVPIDISREHLLRTAQQLQREFSGVRVEPLWADYCAPFELPAAAEAAPQKTVYFPGSTIGNFSPHEAVKFLRRIREVVGDAGGVLIGVDLKKSVEVLERAYNDAQGVTAAFNLNLLQRINSELGADFPIRRFTHRALYNQKAGRIEMHLVSEDACRVTVNKRFPFFFSQGESIWTESSYKYSTPEFAKIAELSGFQVKRLWTDAGRLFSVQYLRASV